MSDTSPHSPHIRHRVRMPDGKHLEVVYGEHLRVSDAPCPPDQGQSQGHAPAQGHTPPAQGRAPAPGYAPDQGAPEQGYALDPLHVCFNCAGELVYPLDWVEEGAEHWRIVLRCPECEARRESVFEQDLVEQLDDELDRAAGTLLSDLKRITHANMTDEVEFFVRALEADLIVPADFSPYR